MTTLTRRLGARTLVRMAVAAACTLAGARLGAQESSALPFAVGERLSYDTRAGGISGRAEMWIEGPVDVRGTQAMVLRFSFVTKVGPFGVSDQTTSWWDARRSATLRFEKRERHLLDRHTEEVEIDAGTGRWRATDGREGDSPSQAPLDELSFIYFIRTLDLTGDSTVRLQRHFDADRNPTTVRFVGHDTITTSVGVFATREVEMRVRDARHYRGEGVIRLSISDDACRRPVRIESRIPGAGNVVMTLAAATPGILECGSPVVIRPSP
jgi:hypothetical protein